MIAFITQQLILFFCRSSVMDKKGNRQRMTILCQLSDSKD